MARWRKLRGDIRATWGRVLAMQLAIAVALAGVGTVLAARAVVAREIGSSYAAARPADATFELSGAVDAALVDAVRAHPDVADADRRQMVRARSRSHDHARWRALLLFVVADFEQLRLNTFRLERGAWPPPRGAILLERTAPPVMGVDVDADASVIVRTSSGAPRALAIAGTVHDPGQAPAWQEHHGYGYITLETLADLGEAPVLHELLVRMRPDPRTVDDVEAAAARIARWLRDRGHEVREVRVPKLRQHPHQLLMDAGQLVLLVFTVLLLVLSAIVLATMLSALLARQVREIGVMKAVGATTRQIAGMYAAFVLGLGAVAIALAVPAAYAGGHALIGAIGWMMNLAIADPSIPVWVFAAQAVLGLAVPLLCAAVPIARATRRTVRQALAAHGAGEHVRPSRLPLPIRNALRRPARLAMTLALLVVGGTLVITASNVERGLMNISAKLARARHYDVELRLREPAAQDSLAVIAGVGGVTSFEAWAAAPATLNTAPSSVVETSPPGIQIVRTYPDGGHGAAMLTAPPATGSQLVRFPLVAGRWLVPEDTDGVVLGNHARARPGDAVAIVVAGVRSSWRVVGLVEELGGGSAFVTAAAFQRVTGIAGATLLRIATTARSARELETIVDAVESALAGRAVSVQSVMSAQLMRSIIDDHVALVGNIVLVIGAILALVGLLGLGSAMAINVAERAREIGIMKAIGASDRRVLWICIAEAAAVGGASALAATALAMPLTALIDAQIARGGFLAPPPFAIAYTAVAGWWLAAIAGSIIASALPARRAARLSVRAALAEV